jgi:hypothetical protein
MLDSKTTLKNLHKEFPNLTLDELFKILDCYVETPSFPHYINWDYKKGNDYLTTITAGDSTGFRSNY